MISSKVLPSEHQMLRAELKCTQRLRLLGGGCVSSATRPEEKTAVSSGQRAEGWLCPTKTVANHHVPLCNAEKFEETE